MGLKYLWDTNTVIYYLKKSFTEAEQRIMNNIINNYKPAISVITEIELLCWKNATEKDVATLNSFVLDSTVFELEVKIKLKTIEIRKTHGLKLPDAVIAATALANSLTLISRNSNDFKKVTNLKLIDPFNLNDIS
ncbi:MAG: type II toxin-antitoxin system VapC family toxin [Mucilaginibacter sp.]